MASVPLWSAVLRRLRPRRRSPHRSSRSSSSSRPCSRPKTPGISSPISSRRALVAPDSLVRRLGRARRRPDRRPSRHAARACRSCPIPIRRCGWPRPLPWASSGTRPRSQPLIDRLTGTPALDAPTAAEAVTALAKIGGRRSGDFFGGVLGGRVALSQEDRTPAFNQVLAEAWRLGGDAPVTALLPFMEDTAAGPRLRAVYSLGRLRAPRGRQPDAARAARSRGVHPLARGPGAHPELRGFGGPRAVGRGGSAAPRGRRPEPAGPDQRPPLARRATRTPRSLGSAKLAPHARRSAARACRCRRPRPSASSAARRRSRALARAAGGKGTFALRRAALVALGRADSAAFAQAAARWRRQRRLARPRRRRGGCGARRAGPRRRRSSPTATAASSPPGSRPGRTRSRAPTRRCSPPPARCSRTADAAVRSVAADAVARAADPADLPALARMYAAHRRATPFPTRPSRRWTRSWPSGRPGPAAQARVDREFLLGAARPAELPAPALGRGQLARGGRALGTGRTRSPPAARCRTTAIWSAAISSAPDSLARPHVIIETEQRGPIEVELLGPDAPLTVANFLRLVDRRFFDRQPLAPRRAQLRRPGRRSARRRLRRPGRRHPRRDQPQPLRRPDARHGALGPGHRHRASGSSTSAPQPHLDGTYTVFGQVVGGTGDPRPDHAGRCDPDDRPGSERGRCRGMSQLGRRAPSLVLAVLVLALRACRPGRAPSSSPSARTRSSTASSTGGSCRGRTSTSTTTPAEADLAPAALAYAEASYDTLAVQFGHEVADPHPADRVRLAHRFRADQHPAVHAARGPARRDRLPQAPRGAAVPGQLRRVPPHAAARDGARLPARHAGRELQPGAPRAAASTSRSGGARGWRSSGRRGRTRATRWSCATSR